MEQAAVFLSRLSLESSACAGKPEQVQATNSAEGGPEIELWRSRDLPNCSFCLLDLPCDAEIFETWTSCSKEEHCWYKVFNWGLFSVFLRFHPPPPLHPRPQCMYRSLCVKVCIGFVPGVKVSVDINFFGHLLKAHRQCLWRWCYTRMRQCESPSWHEGYARCKSRLWLSKGRSRNHDALMMCILVLCLFAFGSIC